MYRSLTHGCNGQGIHRARACLHPISAGRLPTHSDPEAPPYEGRSSASNPWPAQSPESRLPRPALNSMLDYIQVQLNLPRGVNGGWSDQAEYRLADMLAKQKRGSFAMCLMLRQERLVRNGLFMSRIRKPPRLKRKRSSSSSSSSSSSTRKSQLRVAIRKLRMEVADLAEGIASHQELEEENEKLLELTNALREENQAPRAALQT